MDSQEFGFGHIKFEISDTSGMSRVHLDMQIWSLRECSVLEIEIWELSEYRWFEKSRHWMISLRDLVLLLIKRNVQGFVSMHAPVLKDQGNE